ncbi:MAG: hypothetical protein KAT77_02670 [Nanoarchaeota archaeon]|nr:hypothetical protein [Nanoarchaeota archaeon]
MTKVISNPSILNNKELNFVDMHHHSIFSDGNKTPKYIAKYFIKKKRGVCIADHNQIKGAVYLAKQKELFSIPAIEITSKEAKDILGYFYNIRDLQSFWEKEIQKKIRNNALFNLNRTTLSIHDIVEKIKQYSGIPILAHPFTFKPKNAEKFLFDKDFMRKIKGTEIFACGRAKNNQIKLITQLNKPIVAGSDSHLVSSLNTLTGSYFFDKDSFLDSILKKENIIYYQKENYFFKTFHNLIVLKNNIHLKAPKNF